MLPAGMAYLRRRAHGTSSCTTRTSTFRILDLPRELRDNVWEHALCGETSIDLLAREPIENVEERADSPLPRPDTSAASNTSTAALTWPGVRASVRFSPCTDIVLVNKTQGQEYMDRARAAMTLVFKDSENYNFAAFNLPEQAKTVHYVEFHLVLFCHKCSRMKHTDERSCHAVVELLLHQFWVADLILYTLKQLKVVSIHLYVCHENYDINGKAKLPCEPFVRERIEDLYKLPKLKYLTLCKYDWMAQPDLSGPKVMLMEWTPELGLKELALVVKEKVKVPAEKAEESNGVTASSEAVSEGEGDAEESEEAENEELYEEDEELEDQEQAEVEEMELQA